VSSILGWLENEAKGSTSIANLILWGALAIVLYFTFAEFLMSFLGFPPERELVDAETRLGLIGMSDILAPNFSWGEFLWRHEIYRLKEVIFQEMIFRFFPLAVAVRLWGASGRVLLVAVASSIVFGLIHEGYQYWLYPILLQGVAGIYFVILFLKCGGFQKNYAKAVSVCIAVHFFWNMSADLKIVLPGILEFSDALT